MSYSYNKIIALRTPKYPIVISRRIPPYLQPEQITYAKELKTAYNIFHAIEQSLIISLKNHIFSSEDMKKYMQSKNNIFNYALSLQNKEVQEFVNKNKDTFDDLINKMPNDNIRLSIKQLDDLIDQFKSPHSTDFKVNILHMLLTAYHPNTGIQHSLSMKEDLVPKVQEVIDLTPEEVNLLEQACLVHDIGKVINSRLKFTDVIYPSLYSPLQQKRHPKAGSMILQRANLPQELVDAAGMHHMAVDGDGGYGYSETPRVPSKITKIVTVIDIYNALSKSRSYQKAMPKEKIKFIMEIKIKNGEIGEELRPLVDHLLK